MPAGVLSAALSHTSFVFWGLWEAPSSLAEVFAKPAEGRQAESPVWLLCSFKPGSVYEADFVSACQRVLSTVRALSLRAEHMNSIKDPAVSGAKDQRARYQSWE